MKPLSYPLGLLAGSALTVLVSSPSFAVNSQVTQVETTANNNQLQLILKLTGSSETTPKIFTVSRDNNLIADLLNTQLNLADTNGFRQDKPAPGIASIEVLPLDLNTVRVIIKGENAAPTGQVLQQNGRSITLNFTANQTPNTVAQAIPQNNPTITPTPTNNSPTPPPSTQNQNKSPAPQPQVLFPNPQVTIEGQPAPVTNLNPQQLPYAPIPPYLPRAVAPPVGDIAVSNINSMLDKIDLGTSARVPRLVLRDAPTREVLQLLARSAGLNLVFTEDSSGGSGGSTSSGGDGPTITLDLENEPVQDVFNSVLTVSGLEANRQGNTIFVGKKLPMQAKSLVTRTLRLNQVGAGVAAQYLTAQGAETQIPYEDVTINTVGEGAAARTIEERTPTILALKPTEGDGPLLLKGMSIVVDERLNAVTMIGTARQIEIASSLLMQLDARRRQVAVNVKMVDINLLNTGNTSSSFSFAVGDGFFVNDNGRFGMNYGGFRPPTSTEFSSSLISPTVTNNPYAGAGTFLDTNKTFSVPGTGSGTVIIDQRTGTIQRLSNGDALNFLQGIASLSNNPLQAGLSNFTLGTDNVITISALGAPTVSTGANGTATISLPTLFQYPTRFLSQVQAQVTNGNAKILTDPTLVIQEGQQAQIKLTEEVFGGIKVTSVGTGTLEEPIIKDAGLTVTVVVEKIDDNGFVTLRVGPEVSVPGATVNTGTSQGFITLINKRSLTSGSIRMRDGQTLILTGIIQEADRNTVSKVPFLGDLPIIGSLFRSSQRTNTRNEVVVLVTPQVLDDTERSVFGYNYMPGTATREVLQQQGFPVPLTP